MVWFAGLVRGAALRRDGIEFPLDQRVAQQDAPIGVVGVPAFVREIPGRMGARRLDGERVVLRRVEVAVAQLDVQLGPLGMQLLVGLDAGPDRMHLGHP